MAEINVNLNTQESGKAEFSTAKLKDYLEAFLIESTGKVQILIKSRDIVLLDLKDFGGKEYIAVRNQTRAPDGNIINYSFEKFFINGTIDIIIKGGKNTEVKFGILMY